MGKSRKRSGLSISNNEFTGLPYFKPSPKEIDLYLERLRKKIDLGEGGDLDNPDRINKNWREKELIKDIHELDFDEAKKMLRDQLHISDKKCETFLNNLKKLGWEFIGSENFKSDTNTLDFYKDGQYLSFEPVFLINVFGGNFNVQPTTLFRHMNNNVPQIYKWYEGRTMFTMDEKGGDYNLSSNTIRLNSRIFKKGALIVDGDISTKHDSGLNYQQTWEHELTHRFDTFGGTSGDVNSIYATFSGHPYVTHLMNGYSSSYYGEVKSGSIHGNKENLAESTNIFAKKNGRISDYMGNSRTQTLSQKQYLDTNPWADVGYALRNAKTPREFYNFLNFSWNNYLENNL